MFRKTALSLVLAAMVLSPVGPSPAEAKSSVNITIVIGSDISHGRRISCGEGERLLRHRGFRHVRRIDCRGQTYAYHGYRGPHLFRIVVRASNGRIIDLDRLRRPR
jgi:hypothetical protein